MFSIDKFNGSASIKTIYHMPTNGKGLKGIVAVHDLLQPKVNVNPCAKNNRCHQLCLVTNEAEDRLGFKCACKIGYKLHSDRQSCVRIDEFLMYSQQKFIKGKVNKYFYAINIRYLLVMFVKGS